MSKIKKNIKLINKINENTDISPELSYLEAIKPRITSFFFKNKKKTNGTRHLKRIITNLPKQTFKINNLLKTYIRSYGRNNLGRITVRHRGGGVKRRYKKINFNQQNLSRKSIVLSTIYDPNRSAYINLNFDFTHKQFYHDLCADDCEVGDILLNSSEINEFNIGNRAQIRNLPTGSIIHNITLNKIKSQYIRSAGSSGVILKSNNIHSLIKLPSGKVITISSHNYATLGKVSNLFYRNKILGKAGTNRLLGNRPHVRGIAMNPVDHPHGGRSNGGKPSVNFWGFPTKCGYKIKRRKFKFKKENVPF